MRKAILAVATLAALAVMPINANAQDAVGGAIIGAGAGAIIGGAATGRPEGAAVGAVIGGTTDATIGAQVRDQEGGNDGDPGHPRFGPAWFPPRTRYIALSVESKSLLPPLPTMTQLGRLISKSVYPVRSVPIILASASNFSNAG